MGEPSLLLRDDLPQISCRAEHGLQGQAAITRSSAVKGEGTTCKVRRTYKVRTASKRKSRAAAKPPTRLLSADKVTFKDLVLYHTGKPSSFSSLPSSHPSSFSYLSRQKHHDAYYPFANDTLISLISPLESQNHSLSFRSSLSPISTSPSNSSSTLSDGGHSSALFQSSNYPSSSRGATFMIQDENKFSQTLEFLQALKQTLLQVQCLGEWGPFNFGSIDHTLHSIDTYLMEYAKLQDKEHMQNLQQIDELESCLLPKDDKQDNLFSSKTLPYLNTRLSCDIPHNIPFMQNPSLELA